MKLQAAPFLRFALPPEAARVAGLELLRRRARTRGERRAVTSRGRGHAAILGRLAAMELLAQATAGGGADHELEELAACGGAALADVLVTLRRWAAETTVAPVVAALADPRELARYCRSWAHAPPPGPVVRT